jgi:hypothetical protein
MAQQCLGGVGVRPAHGTGEARAEISIFDKTTYQSVYVSHTYTNCCVYPALCKPIRAPTDIQGVRTAKSVKCLADLIDAPAANLKSCITDARPTQRNVSRLDGSCIQAIV